MHGGRDRRSDLLPVAERLRGLQLEHSEAAKTGGAIPMSTREFAVFAPPYKGGPSNRRQSESDAGILGQES
jgi:hypothetical protein